jgi:prepilin-type N-terminal cleavage/methylation domain-containing protein
MKARKPMSRGARGFTLIELIIAMVLISIIAVMAAPLLRLPLVAWLDAGRRSDLERGLQAVQVKLTDDLSRALPGSVRVRQVGPRFLLETLEVRAWGRHRAGLSLAPQACPASCALPANNDALEPACPDTCFTSIGTAVGDAAQVGDWVIVNPQGPGLPGGDPYFGGNAAVAGGIKTRLQGVAAAPEGQRWQIAAHAFPALAANRRFWIVATPVTWDCNPGTQRLTRRWGYPVAAVQPVAFGAATPSAPLATELAACTIRFTPSGPAGDGIVEFNLQLARPAADTQIVERVQLAFSVAVADRP